MLTLTTQYLRMEAAAQRGTGGVSVENGKLGFQPAFRDAHTGQIYTSTFADGRPAPFHLLDGLPEHLVLARDRHGRASRVVGTITAGFVRDGVFHTRMEAAAAVRDDSLLAA
jgi:hypothetical protein